MAGLPVRHGFNGDFQRCYMVCQAPQEEERGDMTGQLLSSPDVGPIGYAIECVQKVMQVSLGAEHGVLLTDAGICCTWGDNRYGQLGRKLVLREEHDQPFPVLPLESHEITQVSSGKHHCLALTIHGLVWAWGRNKKGQVGCGDERDKVLPKQVKLHTKEGGEEDLGGGGATSKENSPIVSIAAGANCSVASAMNSDVWQWGEISEKFKEHQEGSKTGKSKQAKDMGGGKPVNNKFPWRVFKGSEFRATRGPVSITSTGCRVISKELADSGATMRIKELVTGVRGSNSAISKSRLSLAELQSKQKTHDEKKGKTGGSDGSELRSLQDTISMLEREMQMSRHDIEILNRNLDSCELQKKHNQIQIQQLMGQNTQLSNTQDTFTQKFFDDTGRTPERRKLEQKIQDIKDFVEANQNTRMTLLDQRAETDKEKQRLMHQLTLKKEKLDECQKRRDTVMDFGRAATSNAGASDMVLNFLKNETTKIRDHFQGQEEKNDFVDSCQKREMNDVFLTELEGRVKEMMLVAPDYDRAKGVKLMLDDIVALRRESMGMNADRWYKEDLDLRGFFENSPKPEKALPKPKAHANNGALSARLALQ